MPILLPAGMTPYRGITTLMGLFQKFFYGNFLQSQTFSKLKMKAVRRLKQEALILARGECFNRFINKGFAFFECKSWNLDRLLHMETRIREYCQYPAQPQIAPFRNVSTTKVWKLVHAYSTDFFGSFSYQKRVHSKL